VPVNVSILTKVVVAKHNIPSHQIVTNDDLDFASNDRNHLYSGYFTTIDMVVGQMSNQSIAAGMVITKKNIQQPTLVHRNEVIDLTANNNSITVTMKGVARSEGGLHDMIKAYNPSSKKLLDAVVIGPGFFSFNEL
jgi:flagella basal body P-ring formation protein FlgA